MANGQVDEVTKVKAQREDTLAMLKLREIRGNLEAQARKADAERQMARVSATASMRDAQRRADEKDAKEKQAAKKKSQSTDEPVTKNLPTNSVANVKGSSQQGSTQDLTTMLPPTGEAPPFLMDHSRQTSLGMEALDPVVSAPVRRTVDRTNVKPNVLTAAQAQSGQLERVKAMIQQRQFQQTEGRLASQHDTEENRLERKLAIEEIKGKSSAAASKALTILRFGRNARELVESETKDWETHRDTLAEIGADPIDDKTQALYTAGLAKLPSDEHRDEVRKKAAALTAEYDRAAAGTGTVKIFNPDMDSGIQVVPGRDFIRMHRDSPEGIAGVPTTGMRLTSDGKGGMTLETGVSSTAAATRTMQGTLQESVRTGVNSLARLRGIEASYDPEFLEWESQFRYWQLDKQIKAGRRDKLSPDDIRFADRYRNFAGATMGNLNLYIKEITGAQMSEAEAQRLMAAVANLDLNSIAFESDMRRLTREMKLQIARSSMLLAGGFGDENIEKIISDSNNVKGTVTMANGKIVPRSVIQQWDSVPVAETIRVMGDREELHRKFYEKNNPNWTLEQIDSVARQKTEEEFGGVSLR